MNEAHSSCGTQLLLLVVALCTVACGGSDDSNSTRDGGLGWFPNSTKPGSTSDTGGSTSVSTTEVTGGTHASMSGPGSSQGGLGATGGHAATGGNALTGGNGSTVSGGRRATGGSSATGASAATGGAAAADCNSLVNGGPFVSLVRIAEDPPQPMGGVVMNGTYYLTSYAEYTGEGGTTTLPYEAAAKYTIVMSGCSSSGCTMQLSADLAIGDLSISLEGNGTFATRGTTYETQFTCANAEAAGALGGYTATASQLTIFAEDGTDVSVYTRQLL